jgi:hypothetical protein
MLDDIGFRDYWFRIAPLWVLEVSYREYLELQRPNISFQFNERAIRNPKQRKDQILKQEILDFSNAIKDGWYTNLN